MRYHAMAFLAGHLSSGAWMRLPERWRTWWASEWVRRVVSRRREETR